MLGFCPDDVTTAAPSAVRFVARQLGVDPGVLDGYGSRAQTRTDHVNQVKAHLGFCSATNADLEDARDWLAAGALVQDRPVVLFRLVCERLHELRLVRPGLSVIEQSLVGAAREAARKETAARGAHLATPGRCRSLDGLLQVDPELGAARATWLRRLAAQAAPPATHDQMDQGVRVPGLGAGGRALSAGVPKGRRAAGLADWEGSARPAGTSRVALLGGQSSRLRQCMPRFWELLPFCSRRHDDELLEGIDVLKKLNRTRRRTM